MFVLKKQGKIDFEKLSSSVEQSFNQNKKFHGRDISVQQKLNLIRSTLEDLIEQNFVLRNSQNPNVLEFKQ